mmetsp:Transcript_15821/g.36896  ORF Transcript_15821/g.36896 Transcript_15821/m.36896 type:complete len:233 (+) Transcript_15821:393-1091(+)
MGEMTCSFFLSGDGKIGLRGGFWKPRFGLALASPSAAAVAAAAAAAAAAISLAPSWRCWFSERSLRESNPSIRGESNGLKERDDLLCSCCCGEAGPGGRIAPTGGADGGGGLTAPFDGADGGGGRTTPGGGADGGGGRVAGEGGEGAPTFGGAGPGAMAYFDGLLNELLPLPLFFDGRCISTEPFSALAGTDGGPGGGAGEDGAPNLDARNSPPNPLDRFDPLPPLSFSFCA